MGQIHFHLRSFPLLPILIPKVEFFFHSRGIPVEFPFPSSSQIQTLRRSEKQRESSKSDIFFRTHDQPDEKPGAQLKLAGGLLTANLVLSRAMRNKTSARSFSSK